MQLECDRLRRMLSGTNEEEEGKVTSTKTRETTTLPPALHIEGMALQCHLDNIILSCIEFLKFATSQSYPIFALRIYYPLNSVLYWACV